MHGHLEVMKWLFNHGGAQGDIQKQDRSDSPLCVALELGHFEVVKWLILNGSFSTHDNGVIDNMVMRNNMRPQTGIQWS